MKANSLIKGGKTGFSIFDFFPKSLLIFRFHLPIGPPNKMCEFFSLFLSIHFHPLRVCVHNHVYVSTHTRIVANFMRVKCFFLSFFFFILNSWQLPAFLCQPMSEQFYVCLEHCECSFFFLKYRKH